MLKFVIIPILAGFCHGFLLNNNTVVSSGGQPPMTDDHYLLLTDLLGLERQSTEKLKNSMAQMESFVLQLQKQLTSTMQEVASLKSNNNADQTQKILELKNETAVLKNTVTKMKDDHNNLKNTVDELQRKLGQVQTDSNALKQDNLKLKKQVEILSNSSNNFNQELKLFAGSAIAAEIQNVTTLTKNIESLNVKVSSMNSKLSVLASNSFSRSQDFLALINQTSLSNQKINQLINQAQVLENKSMQQSMEVSDLTSKEISLQTSVDILENNMKDLQSNQTGAAVELNLIKQRITNLETHKGAEVILTSCGNGGDIRYNSGQVIKFPVTKTAYGITKLDEFHTTGKFTCEKPGTYLFSVFIMSYSTDSQYELFKNGEHLTYVYINGEPKSTSDFHSAASTMAVQLDKGDQFYVKSFGTMNIYDSYSCITVIKMR